MKNFLKYTFASFLGVFLALILLILIGMGIVSALLSSSPEEVKLKEKTILQMDLSTPITDRTINSPFEVMSFTTMELTGTLGLYDILRNLEKAADDPNISGVLIQTDIITPGISTLVEIREALLKFRESGKFVVAYGDFYTQAGYFLASAADKVFINPEGFIEFKGLRSEVMFYTGALEKLGVEVQVLRYGKFKAAVEPFMQKEMSDANKEQTMTYLSSIWDYMLDGISSGRHIETDQLNELADNMTVRSPESALENGFVDGLKYYDELQDELRELSGLAADAKIPSVSMKKYIHVQPSEKKEYTTDRIAVIFATGTIGMNQESAMMIGGHPMAKTIREARKDKRVKAIVLRVNSPGGNAISSEVIRREVQLAASEKPLIVSMGDYAASGGYMISIPGSKILASPTTLTGSIGVFGLLPNFENLLENKLGLTFDGVQTNDMSGIGSINRPLTDEERDVLQEGINTFYETFTREVAEGREIDIEKVLDIAEGRVWSGADAIGIGLVDELGGLSRAIELAAEEAGLDNYRVRELPYLKDPLEEILQQLTGKSASARAMLESEIPAVRDIREIMQGSRIQARLPYNINIH
jgi:protease-4